MNKKNLKLILLSALVLSFVVFIGCSDDSSMNPSNSEIAVQEDYDDLALELGLSLAEEDAGILDTNPGMDFHFPRGRGHHGGHGDHHPVQNDTTIVRDGITITIDLTFYDEEGNASEMYDSLTTVRMTRESTIEGTIEGPHRSATIDHQGFVERNNIRPEDVEHTINGTSTRSISSTFTPRWRDLQRTMTAEHSFNKNDVIVSTDRETHPYPLSGTIEGSSSVSGHADFEDDYREFTHEISYVMTFDGTRYAHVEMDNGMVYWIDLDTGLTYRERPDGL